MKIAIIGQPEIGKTSVAEALINKCDMPIVVECTNQNPKNKLMKKNDLAAYLLMAEVAAQDPERANEMAKAYDSGKGESKQPKTKKVKKQRAKNRAALKARKKNRRK